MLIDIIFIVVIILAIFKGLRKGLILGLFSLVAFMIGLAAALKLSVVVANYLKGSVSSLTKWLPMISFLLVFIAVILLVGLVARLIKKTLQFAMLGWLDSLGGLVLYLALYIFIFSIFLFYAEKLLIFKPDVIANSKIYPYIAPWGPRVMDSLGKVIPLFKDMFAQLENFFDGVAKKAG
ncbi:MAG: CvpA family protein [Chitinophagaceae bacterium]|nr:CvpA family protein [Chitinophagaceae bacterium]